MLVNHQNVLAPCIYYLYRSSDDTCVYMYKGVGHLRWHWGVSRWAAYSKNDVIPSALVKTPTLAFTHKEWNMEEGICFVNLAVVRAVCIIQKVRGTIIVVIIERDKMYKKQKKKKSVRMGILLGGRVRLHWLLLQLLTNNRKFLFAESFPFRPHKDISEIGHSLNMRKRLTYIYHCWSNCQNKNIVNSNNYTYKCTQILLTVFSERFSYSS